jgi:hypothetical protein
MYQGRVSKNRHLSSLLAVPRNEFLLSLSVLVFVMRPFLVNAILAVAVISASDASFGLTARQQLPSTFNIVCTLTAQ